MFLKHTIRITWKTIVLLLPFAISCGPGGDPERALEEYLQAAVSRDTVGVRLLSCGEEVPQLSSWKIIHRGAGAGDISQLPEGDGDDPGHDRHVAEQV